MPTVNTPTLSLTKIAQNVIIRVTFNVVFTEHERQFTEAGVTYEEHIDVFGIDSTGTLITSFPIAPLPVTTGAGDQIVARDVARLVTRTLLDEDPGVGDDDEIRCRIRIRSVGVPPEFTPDVFTPELVLIST
jgi:hypothetical protein